MALQMVATDWARSLSASPEILPQPPGCCPGGFRLLQGCFRHQVMRARSSSMCKISAWLHSHCHQTMRDDSHSQCRQNDTCNVMKSGKEFAGIKVTLL